MKNKENSLSHYIYISLAFHICIVVMLTVRVLFFPSEAPTHLQAVRIDVVALPDKVMEPSTAPKVEAPKPVKEGKQAKIEKPAEKAEPKVEEKPKAIALEKKPTKKKERVEDEQNSAIARLKALKKLKDKQAEAPKEEEFKGNQVSKGNSLSGLEQLHHDNYMAELDKHIRSFWNLPEWLANGNFNARVLLLINKSGGVNRKSFILKSGNDLFDEHVFSTIEKASPLPAPPANFDRYATQGVEIRFPE